MEELGHGDRPVAGLTRKPRISHPVLSRHPRLLRQAGLAGRQPGGARHLCRLRSDGAGAVRGYSQRVREDAATGTGWPPPARAGRGAGRDRAAAARVRRAVLPRTGPPAGGPAAPTSGGRRPIAGPPARLINRWHLCSDPAGATEVEVQFLAGAPGSTRVRLEHRAWDALEDGAVRRDRNQAGWQQVLQPDTARHR